jgi:hypothetical protein
MMAAPMSASHSGKSMLTLAVRSRQTERKIYAKLSGQVGREGRTAARVRKEIRGLAQQFSYVAIRPSRPVQLFKFF